jgi:hypothetical protein
LTNKSLRQVFRQAENWGRFAAALDSKQLRQRIKSCQRMFEVTFVVSGFAESPGLPQRLNHRFKNFMDTDFMMTAHRSKTHTDKLLAELATSFLGTAFVKNDPPHFLDKPAHPQIVEIKTPPGAGAKPRRRGRK